MLFSQTEQWLTIGGGHLEWVAAEQARVMLSQSSGPGWSMSRLPLGPSLGQCCGGVVTLLYETLGAEDLAGWKSWIAPCGPVRRPAAVHNCSQTAISRLISKALQLWTSPDWSTTARKASGWRTCRPRP
ncbi:xanthine and Co dehydrogenase maturation factor [Alcaligenes sp. HPC1271]|nr:xanthine and Co dehydrogenase maturation factor [Alcaligenes sp. HPC1271]